MPNDECFHIGDAETPEQVLQRHNAPAVAQEREWTDEREVQLDSTVMFGKGWDSFGWEHLRSETVAPNGERFVVWPEGHGPTRRWSAYGGGLGMMGYLAFATEDEAKAAVERWIGAEPPAPQDREPQGEGLVERLSGRAEWIDRQYPRTGLVYVQVRQDFMAATADDLREAARALLEVEDAKAAVAASGIGGIYDEFGDLSDTVRQLLHYIEERIPVSSDNKRVEDARAALSAPTEATEPRLPLAGASGAFVPSPGGGVLHAHPDGSATLHDATTRCPECPEATERPAQGEAEPVAPEWFATPEDFAEHLHRIGWSSPGDAQWEKIREVWRALAPQEPARREGE